MQRGPDLCFKFRLGDVRPDESVKWVRDTDGATNAFGRHEAISTVSCCSSVPQTVKPFPKAFHLAFGHTTKPCAHIIAFFWSATANLHFSKIAETPQPARFCRLMGGSRPSCRRSPGSQKAPSIGASVRIWDEHEFCEVGEPIQARVRLPFLMLWSLSAERMLSDLNNLFKQGGLGLRFPHPARCRSSHKRNSQREVPKACGKVLCPPFKEAGDSAFPGLESPTRSERSLIRAYRALEYLA